MRTKRNKHRKEVGKKRRGDVTNGSQPVTMHTVEAAVKRGSKDDRCGCVSTGSQPVSTIETVVNRGRAEVVIDEKSKKFPELRGMQDTSTKKVDPT
jgi:hypothetical protein